MSEKSKNRKKELEDFLRYSQDQMSEEERNVFERSLEQDAFDAEALEGLSSITPDEANADLARLQAQINKRISRQLETTPSARSTRTMWYRVAAAVAVLLVVTSVLFTLFNDRMGQLDRKVAESPETEKEALPPTSLVEKKAVESSEEITPIKSEIKDAGVEAPKRKESDMFKSVKAETEPDVESEIASEEIVEEKSAPEEPVSTEIADIQIEEPEEAEVQADMVHVEDEILADEMAAPAPAIAADRQAAAKSMKRGRVEQLQVAGAVAAEQQSISGVVISGDDKQPLQGVFVAVKGSETGTVTDLEGRFQILIEDASQNTLLTQFIGMKSKEISFQDQEELMITLEPEEISLEEVVVFAAAPQKTSPTLGYSVILPESDADQGKSDFRSAIPVGGKKEFNEYIKSNIQFPEHDTELTRAVVVLDFNIGVEGRPAKISVLRSPGKSFSDEAIRLLVEGPSWQPAEVNGVKIEQSTRIRIVFKKD